MYMRDSTVFILFVTLAFIQLVFFRFNLLCDVLMLILSILYLIRIFKNKFNLLELHIISMDPMGDPQEKARSYVIRRSLFVALLVFILDLFYISNHLLPESDFMIWTMNLFPFLLLIGFGIYELTMNQLAKRRLLKRRANSK